MHKFSSVFALRTCGDGELIETRGILTFADRYSAKRLPFNKLPRVVNRDDEILPNFG